MPSRLARRARGVGDSSADAVAGQAFALLVISIRRGSKLATAMEAKGFGSGRPRSWARESSFGRREWALIGIGAAIAAVAVIAAVTTGNWHFVLDSMTATPRRPRPHVTLIDGRSGSGKTDLARRMVDRAPETTLIRLDDIYPGWDGLDAGSRHVHDHVLEPLAAGRRARWQRWDWECRRAGRVARRRCDAAAHHRGVRSAQPSQSRPGGCRDLGGAGRGDPQAAGARPGR